MNLSNIFINNLRMEFDPNNPDSYPEELTKRIVTIPRLLDNGTFSNDNIELTLLLKGKTTKIELQGPAWIWRDDHGEMNRGDNRLPCVVTWQGTCFWSTDTAGDWGVSLCGTDEKQFSDQYEWYFLGGDNNNQYLHREQLPAVKTYDGKYQWWEHGNFLGDSDNPPHGAIWPGQTIKSGLKH